MIINVTVIIVAIKKIGGKEHGNYMGTYYWSNSRLDSK
jgi:hypothetical protein